MGAGGPHLRRADGALHGGRPERRADHERPEDLEGPTHPVGRSARRRGPGRLRGGAGTRAEPLRLEDEERGPRTRGLLVRAFRCPSDHRRFGRVHHDEYHPDGEAGEQFGVLDSHLLLRSHARRGRRPRCARAPVSAGMVALRSADSNGGARGCRPADHSAGRQPGFLGRWARASAGFSACAG